MISNVGTKGSTVFPSSPTNLVCSNSVPKCNCDLIMSFFSSTVLIHCYILWRKYVYWWEHKICFRTYLIHIPSHRIADPMLERFILKIELHVWLPGCSFSHGEEALDCSFWDRLHELWLAEFHFITILSQQVSQTNSIINLLTEIVCIG